MQGIYYAFWCHPGLQYFYMLTVLGFILTGLVFRNTFNKDENLIPRFLFEESMNCLILLQLLQAGIFHHICHLWICTEPPLVLYEWIWE